MRDISDSLITQAAIQLMLRHEGPWRGHDARTLVKTSLLVVHERIAPESFRRLVMASQQVGRELERVGEALATVPWPIEEVQAGIAALLPAHAQGEAMIAFVHGLAARVKGARIDRPTRGDWYGAVSDVMHRTGVSTTDLGLEARLRLADGAEELRMQRQQRLAAQAQMLLDVELADLCTALREMLAAPAPAIPPEDTSRTRPQRLPSSTLDALATVALPAVRTMFRTWLEELSPCAQHAVQRRIEGLCQGLALAQMWTKPIVGIKGLPLRELRVIAERTHYRILYLQPGGSKPAVLAHGLRRDLHDLVQQAAALAAGLPS